VKIGPGWDTRAGKIAGGVGAVLLLLSLTICALPAPPPEVAVERHGDHLNVEITVTDGPFLPAIGEVVRSERAKLIDSSGLKTATFVFRQDTSRPFATLGFDVPQLLEVDPETSDAAVLDLAREVSERPPTGPPLLRPECQAADDALRGSRLCALVLGRSIGGTADDGLPPSCEPAVVP